MQNIDWEKMSAPWLAFEAQLEAAHLSVQDSLLRRAALQNGQRVLDIGCGTGSSLLAASEAVGPKGHVTGVDIAPPLVSRAAARVADNVTVLTGDAGTLTHDDPFDTAISLFGTMFFADTTAAFANIKTALKPGARMFFAAWGPPTNNPWFGTARHVFEAHLGPLPKPDPTAPGPFRFANAPLVSKEIADAGMDVSFETEALHLRTGQSAESLAQMQLTIMGSALLAGIDLTDADRAALQQKLSEALGQLQHADEVIVPAEVHFFTATA